MVSTECIIIPKPSVYSELQEDNNGIIRNFRFQSSVM